MLSAIEISIGRSGAFSAQRIGRSPSLRGLVKIPQRMSVAFRLCFVGGFLWRRPDLEFDENHDAWSEQYCVQPLSEAKQRNFKEDRPVGCRATDLRECISEEFDLALPSPNLFGFGSRVKGDVSACKLADDRVRFGSLELVHRCCVERPLSCLKFLSVKNHK